MLTKEKQIQSGRPLILGGREIGSGSKGVAVGGLIDYFWPNVVGLDKTESRIALGYVCGK
jgi:hypothetical protein